MLRKISMLCLLVFFTLTTYAQDINLTGIITDSLTNEPIPYATIAISGTAIGCVSNEEGRFNLVVPQAYLASTLELQCLGYRSDSVSIETFSSDGLDTLKMIASATELNEVIVLAQSIESTLSEIVEVSQTDLNGGIILNAYYREFGYMDGEPGTYADGFMDC